MTRIWFAGIAFVAVLAGSLPAAAVPVTETETAKTVNSVSITDGSVAGIVVVNNAGASNSCFLKLIFWDSTTERGKTMLAMLVSAQEMDTAVTITYTRDGNSCTLTQVIAL